MNIKGNIKKDRLFEEFQLDINNNKIKNSQESLIYLLTTAVIKL